MFFGFIIIGFFISSISIVLLLIVMKFTDKNYKNATYDKQFKIAIIISFIVAFFLVYVPEYVNNKKNVESTTYSQASLESTVPSTSKHKSITYSDYDEAYEKGYNNGYDDGYFDGISGSDMSVHEILNSEAFSIIREEAELYASDAYDWHPEEACEIILCYLNQEKFIDAVPTKDEYMEAVGTLIAFYDFFYSN